MSENFGSGAQDHSETVARRHQPSRGKRSARRTWLFRLTASILSPILFLAAMELLLRLVGYGHPTDFFVRSEIAGEPVYIENISFGRRFFPEGMQRAPLPVSFGTEKPGGAYRIFVLGGSAALGFPDSSFSFARIVETMLDARYPDTQFEVLNTSMTAINSHVVVPIARDCAKHQPDLFVVYMGNNEVIGPYGVSDVLGSHSPHLGLIRASIWTKTTRTGALLAHLSQTVASADSKPSTWQGMRIFMERQFRHDDPRMVSVYSHFDRNLRDICDTGRSAGANVIVCTVASNLKDSPPFASLPAAGLSSAQSEKWSRLFAEGNQFEVAQDHAAAIERYQRALQIDDQRADLQFRLARCLLAFGRAEEARQHFILARDRDALHFRADSKLNEVIRARIAGRDSAGAQLVDVVREFEAASEDKLPGNSLFYEHVHLTFHGNYVLARSVFERIAELLPEQIRRQASGAAEPLSEAACIDRLVFTDWSRLTALTQLDHLYSQAPFVGQLYEDERKASMQTALSQLGQRLEAGGIADAMTKYEQAVERRPTDVMWRQDLAVLLLSRDEFARAVTHLAELQKQLPYHPVPHVLMAQALTGQGEHYRALAQCDKALQLQPGWPQAVQMKAEIEATLRRPR